MPAHDTMSTDLLVVGAGPAGSAAATWAARSGREVLLADAATFPRDKPCVRTGWINSVICSGRVAWVPRSWW